MQLIKSGTLRGWLYRRPCITGKEKGTGMRSDRFVPMQRDEESVAYIEDTYLLAALMTYDPSIRYTPVMDRAGRVAFEVNGDTSPLVGKLYSGESAPLNTYISNLKALRSAIFAMKKAGSVGARGFDSHRK